MTSLDQRFYPTDMIPGLVFLPDAKKPTAEDKKKLGNAESNHHGPIQQLCRACGWTTYNEMTSSYLPRLRIFHTRGNSGLWSMGNDWLIWDRPDGGGQGNDYMTYQFLKQQGTKNIPLVEAMHQYGKSGDPFQFTVMSRAKGVPLQSVWHGLSSEERKGYAEQVTAALRELRKFTSPVPRRVDGSPLWDNIIGRCYVSKKCQNIKNTTEEWLGSIDEELRFGIARSYRTLDKDFIEAKLKELKADFPDGAPYVLTHGDLHFENIIVNNGKIEAIIDWETAGYYPWWFERFASLNRVYSSGAGELFGTVWAELDPDHDPKQFKDKVSNHVRPLESAYYFCLLEHTEDLDVWRRPAFCECKPYGGVIYRRDWDAELEHKIDYKGEKQKIIL